MAKFRLHRGSLEESMATVCEVTSFADINAIIKPDTVVSVEKYGYDARINWETYLVRAAHGVVGMTDGPVPNL